MLLLAAEDPYKNHLQEGITGGKDPKEPVP